MKKILIAASLNTGNRYIDDLFQHLVKKNHNIEISVHSFWNKYKKFDVIHIQWLEVLFFWDLKGIDKQKMDAFKNRLAELKKSSNTKIILTRHNKLPHNMYGNEDNIKKTYKLIYRYCDAIIHLGKFSVEDFKTEEPVFSSRIQHFIINHGNYFSLPNISNKEFARERLNIKKEKKVILAFGILRNKEEHKMILKAFEALDIKNKHLLANNWNGKLLPLRDRIRIKPKENFTLHNNFISEDEIQYYINACDILFIPRINTLNSGNVFLGFTFKKIVVGPAIGNIKEILEETGNPSFNPNEPATIEEALRCGFDKLDTDLGEKNYQFAKINCNWEDISHEHLKLYNSL